MTACRLLLFVAFSRRSLALRSRSFFSNHTRCFHRPFVKTRKYLPVDYRSLLHATVAPAMSLDYLSSELASPALLGVSRRQEPTPHFEAKRCRTIRGNSAVYRLQTTDEHEKQHQTDIGHCTRTPGTRHSIITCNNHGSDMRRSPSRDRGRVNDRK